MATFSWKPGFQRNAMLYPGQGYRRVARVPRPVRAIA